MKNFDLQSIVQCTLLMIKENKIFHSTILCIFGAEAEHNIVEKLKQMIDSEHCTIHRRLDRFYFQSKWFTLWNWFNLIDIFLFEIKSFVRSRTSLKYWKLNEGMHTPLFDVWWFANERNRFILAFAIVRRPTVSIGYKYMLSTSTPNSSWSLKLRFKFRWAIIDVWMLKKKKKKEDAR
jgi:hypothetical protein